MKTIRKLMIIGKMKKAMCMRAVIGFNREKKCEN